MSKFNDAVKKFEDKFQIKVDFEAMDVTANKFKYLDDNLFEVGERNANATKYKSYLTQLLDNYVQSRTNVTVGQSQYSLSGLNLHEFVDAYEEIMRARHEENPQDERKRSRHEGMTTSIIGIARQIVNKYDQPLSGIWAYQLTKERVSFEDFKVSIDAELYAITMNGKAMETFEASAANVYTAHKAMEKTWNDRSVFWVMIHPVQAYRQYNYLQKLKDCVDWLKDKGTPEPAVGNLVSGSMIKEVYDLADRTSEQRRIENERRRKARSQSQPENKENVNVDNKEKVSVNDKENVNVNNNDKDKVNKTAQENSLVADGKIKSWNEAESIFSDPQTNEEMQEKVSGMLGEYGGDELTVEFAKYTVFNSMRGMSNRLWEDFNGSTLNPKVNLPRTDEQREEFIRSHAFNGPKLIYKAISDEYKMTVAERLIAAQKIANFGLTQISPIASYSRYAQYGENYFINNATPDNIREMTGYEGNIDDLIHEVKRGLGIEKEQLKNIQSDVNVDSNEVLSSEVKDPDNVIHIEKSMVN